MKLFLRFAGLFAHGQIPQDALELLDLRRHVREIKTAQMGGQMHQVQTKAHFVDCLFNHTMEIG